VLNPNKRLAAGTKYRAVVTIGAEDLAGNALDQNPTKAGNQQKSWTFTTKG
jgi:Bacterial Ig-like domain